MSFPTTTPQRVPALDGLNENDDLTSTGGTVAPPLATALNDQITQLNAEAAQLNGMLGLTTSVVGSSVVDPVTIYDSGGGQNNDFNFTVNGVTKNVVFAGSPGGTSTSLLSIVAQINAIVPSIASRTTSGWHGIVTLTDATNSITILSGNANTTIGFTTSQTNRKGSAYYTAWKNLVSTEITDQATQTTSLNLILGYLQTLMQEYQPPYDTTYGQVKTYKDVVISYLVTIATDSSTNTSNLAFNVNTDSNLTTRRDTTVASHLAHVNGFITYMNARLTQIGTQLTAEGLFDKRFAWVDYRANRGTGSVPAIARTTNSQTQSSTDEENDTTAINSF